MKLQPRRPQTQHLYQPLSHAAFCLPDIQKCNDIRRKLGLRLKPSPRYLLITFSPFPSHSQPPAACWQLVVPKTSHAEGSSNPNSLFLVSVTSLQAPQEFHFHVWLLRTPVAAGSAGEPRSLHSSFLPSSPLPPATENEDDSRGHFDCTDTGL